VETKACNGVTVMDRLKFYNLASVNNISEIDYMTSSLKNFNPRHELSTYRVTDEDLMAPDLISYKVYGTEEYWWLILRFNRIIDPFTELETGDLLYIPNIVDIYEWYKSNRRR
jgi:hypothetical protein